MPLLCRPTDAEGLVHVYGRGTLEARALDDCDLGNVEFGKFAPMVIFKDVFCSLGKCFSAVNMNMPATWCAISVISSSFSRGCKCGVGDVLIGAARLLPDYNGLPNVLTSTIKSPR